jgi:hypothetical protein
MDAHARRGVMKTVADLVAGDTAWVTDPNRLPTRVTISRVGRINIYVGTWRSSEECFSRATGQVKDAYGNRRLLTDDQHTLSLAAAGARKRLQDFDVRVGYQHSDETVVAIAEALAPLMGAPR